MSLCVDKNGSSVSIGSQVVIIKLNNDLASFLTAEELAEVQTMMSEIFEVYDIDDYGHAWVEKRWIKADGKETNHSLALHAEEMVLVSA